MISSIAPDGGHYHNVTKLVNIGNAAHGYPDDSRGNEKDDVYASVGNNSSIYQSRKIGK